MKKTKLPKYRVRKPYSYYGVCCRCGYRGSGWPDSGECPSCGEVN